MKHKIKFLTLVILFLACLIPQIVFAESSSSDLSILSVSGTGTAKTKPNIATISINVNTKGKTASEAVSSNSTATQKLINTLTRAGITEQDIQTNNLSVTPVYKSNPQGLNDTSTISGYEVNNSVQATIRKTSDVGSVIDMISSAGNFTINGISFGLDQSTDQENEALKKAVSDAKRKADIVTAAAGKTITGIKNITVGGNPGVFRSAEAGLSSADIPILPGNISVSESVSIDYILSK